MTKRALLILALVLLPLAAQASPLTVSDVTVQTQVGTGRVQAHGRVTNNTTQTINGVKTWFVLWDAGGQTAKFVMY